MKRLLGALAAVSAVIFCSWSHAAEPAVEMMLEQGPLPNVSAGQTECQTEIVLAGHAEATPLRPLPRPPLPDSIDPEYDAPGTAAGNPFAEELASRQPPPDVVGEAYVASEPSCACVACDPCQPCAAACCGGSCCRIDLPFVPADQNVRRLLAPRWLSRRDLTLGGWVQQGISTTGNRPLDRYNGLVGFNDRDGEYQMNQLYFFLERKADTGGCGWDVGGRVDFLYGTDARFVECVDGLESNWDQQGRFYQAALPQFYLDAAVNDWTVRMGHFYSIIGYEQAPAPENFFYSHAYTRLYGEPYTHMGLLAEYSLSDRASLSGGFHRGWDQLDDTDGADRLGFLGGLSWTSPDKSRTLAFALTTGEQGPGDNTVMYSLVGTQQLGSRLKYVIQHDYGQSSGGPNAPRLAEWYGINQYVLFALNSKWAIGTRIEWFRDKQGVRVHGIGDGNLATGPYAGDFYEVTLGLNWRPRRNVLVRPEVRWDWYHGQAGPRGLLPYDSGDSSRQFMAGCDLVVQF